MELDHLKEMWKDADKSSLPINETSLQQMLNHRSKMPIAIMKRNLRLEVFFLILIYGYIIWMISTEGDTGFLYYDIALLLIAILFFVYARYKYRLLSNMECMGCEVKTNLNLQVISLEKLIKLYFKIGNISVVLVYLITGAISYMETEGETASLPKTVEILIFLIIGSILAVINYYFGRWYLYNLYGKHIQKLKNILYEMDESDPG
jgi:hypothetical protein